MKILGFLMSILMSVSVWATMQYSNGYGSASGFCDGSPSGYWCMDNVKQNARRDALSQAEMNCRIHNGTPQPSYTASCYSEYCSPFSIPTNAPSQWVSCRSDCSLGCEIKEYE